VLIGPLDTEGFAVADGGNDKPVGAKVSIVGDETPGVGAVVGIEGGSLTDGAEGMVDTDGADGELGCWVGVAPAGDGAFVPIGEVVLEGGCAGGGVDGAVGGNGAAVTLICSGGFPCL
jgi:hypothetical protein